LDRVLDPRNSEFGIQNADTDPMQCLNSAS
jgi:hypothetical protein